MRYPEQVNITPRSFQGHDDLLRMQELLVAGRKSGNGSYYVHIGDLSWWLYYTYPGEESWEHIYLWESPQGDDLLGGWALLDPHLHTFDVFVHPTLRGTERAGQMYLWAEKRAAEIAASHGDREISNIWVSAGDLPLIAHFEFRGFVRDREHHVHMSRTLDEPLSQVAPPHGFQVRDMRNENDVVQRATASYAAFQSRTPWERYLDRYRRFRSSPVYKPQHDLVVAALDGRLSSFCIIWLDSVNKVGLFEPVGTHPHFQRLGLGKTLMLAGLERMRASGMHTAIVNTDHDNLAAQQLYRSVGFRETDRLYAYKKSLDKFQDKGQEHGG